MKKNNVSSSQRGLKRDAKNKARLKRAKSLREFNHLAAQVKFMQAYVEQQKSAQSEPAVSLMGTQETGDADASQSS